MNWMSKMREIINFYEEKYFKQMFSFSLVRNINSEIDSLNIRIVFLFYSLFSCFYIDFSIVNSISLRCELIDFD